MPDLAPLTPSAMALLAFAAWLLVLVVSLGVYRSLLVVTAGRAANGFAASGEDVGPFGLRLTRAHANCYESLPAIGAVLLYAIATGQTAVTDPLATVLIGARLAQSGVHLLSTSRPAVILRLVFFLVQVLITLYWIGLLAGLI